MSYDEEHQRRSRVVVETPTQRREVDYQQTRYVPERSGYSTGVVVAVALTAIAATAVIFLFLMNSGDEETTNVNVNTRLPVAQTTPLPVMQATPLPTPIPTLPPPVTTTTVPGVVVPPTDTTIPPASTTTTAPTTAPTPNQPDEATIRQNVNAKIQADAELSDTDVLAEINGNRVTLTGTVRSADLKRRAERLAVSVRGVRVVDNQIAVVPDPAPAATP